MDQSKKVVGRRQMFRKVKKALENVVSELNKSSSICVNSEYDLEHKDIFLKEIDSSENIKQFNEVNVDDEMNSSCEIKLKNIVHCETNVTLFKYNEADEVPLHHEFSNLIAKWAIESNTPRRSLSTLLKILHPYHADLPLDYRTLLKTPKNTIFKTLSNGEYVHFGLKKNIYNYLMTHEVENELKISFNVDGIPLFKSTKTSLWPILGLMINSLQNTPFTVGIFCGSGKPHPLKDFLNDFIVELKDLLQNGLVYDNRNYKIEVHSFVCDIPARSYLKCIKGHGGYSCCEKCTVVGNRILGRVIYKDLTAPRRTDATFELQIDKDHHTGKSPLVELGIGLVSTFPIDYMHNICLGVMRKLMNIWIDGPSTVKLNKTAIEKISDYLVSLRNYIPCEFNRKPRSLVDLARWKATEFRMFLLYLGPVILKVMCKPPIFENFLLLHSAISILISDMHISQLGTCSANQFLAIFVKHSKQLYGSQFMIYNVHLVTHLADDVDRYGQLDNFSSFPFENFLGYFKRLVKSPTHPLQQICRRLKEIENCGKKSSVQFKDILCYMEHEMGPLGNNNLGCKQFKKLILNNFTLCTIFHSKADSYCYVGDKVVQIHNIIMKFDGTIAILGKQYNSQRSLYDYPLSSELLNIFMITDPSVDIKMWSIFDIVCKYLVIPMKNTSEMAAFPIIHSLTNK